jgi:acetyl-CoA acyltransferase
MTTAVIVDVVRTRSGRGKPGGALADEHPVDLFASVLAALVERNELDPALVDDVIGGCVSQAGTQAVNVTRSAVLAAGFPHTVPAVTIDRQCGSSQQAVTFAAQGIVAGAYDVVIAGGVEMMSRNPINFATMRLDPWGSAGERYDFVGQGVSAELVAARWGLTREELDVFAARSHELAASTDFSTEILGGTDETIRPGTSAESLAALSPAFYSPELAARFPEIGWNITAGNSSPLTDGASAALIMSEQRAHELGLTPRARFHAFAVAGSDPIEMLTGIMPATRRILDRSKVPLDEIDQYEINEAFASVPLAWLREFDADPGRLNPRGGAIALGHALGSSGTRLLATLLTGLEASGGRYGLQVMCEGAGMANATIIERL